MGSGDDLVVVGGFWCEVFEDDDMLGFFGEVGIGEFGLV